MEKEGKYIQWLYELNKSSGQLVGGKGANLAEMYNSKFPVPPAFVITTFAYNYFTQNIKQKIDSILSNIDVNNTEDLSEKASEIRQLIINNPIPQDLEEDILEAYEDISIDRNSMEIAKSDALNILKHGQEPIFVAVRSSATTEDLADASFAGQQETYLNVKGNRDLIEKVKRVFASLFTARAIFYRKKRGFSNEKFALAVVVQKMVDSDRSGVMFSSNPIKDNKNVVIEAVFGLGEGIVSGKIKPDNYEVSRDLEIINKSISNKKIALVRNSQGEVATVSLKNEIANSPVLEDGQIKSLANLALRIEEHYGKPQDIEFAVEAGELYITQSRPITTQAASSEKEISGNVLLKGLAASPGVGSGKVKIVNSIEELNKVKEGDILVTEMTNPDMVVSMQKASGIVTDEGGLTCHAAIVSREMGIPCIVGTGNATSILKENQEITVDGFHGNVLEGISKEKKVEILPIEKTNTKIKVIVDLPEAADRAAKTKCESIGLLRLEGIIASSGKHPNLYIKNGNWDEYIKTIEEGIEKISQPFKEIWIRTSDLRCDEYPTLEGAPKDDESNPMMGDHAIRFALKHKELLKAELQALKNVAERNKEKTFGFMIPLVISPEEVIEAKKIATELQLENIKKGIMVETPAAALIIKDLLKVGVDFISFGTNDLTQFILAVDRNNERVQHLYNESHPAVLNAIKRVIRTCQELGVESSICGQAASNKSMVKHLLEYGITSLSVNADAASEISKFVAEYESKTNQMSETKKPSIEEKQKNNEKHTPQETIKEIEKKISNEIGNQMEKMIDKETDAKPRKQEITFETKKPVQIPAYVADISQASKNYEVINKFIENTENENDPEEFSQYENNFMQKQIEPIKEEKKPVLTEEELDEVSNVF